MKFYRFYKLIIKHSRLRVIFFLPSHECGSSQVQLCHLSVIRGDVSCLFNALSDPQKAFYTAPDDADKTYEPLSDCEIGDVKFLFSQWRQFHHEGKL